MTTTEGRLTPEPGTNVQRLEWLDDQFCKQLAACSPAQRETWKRHVEAVRAGLDAIAELDAVRRERDARAEVWECPTCLFRFAVEHVDDATGTHSCPVCAEQRLTRELDEARKDSARLEWIERQAHAAYDIDLDVVIATIDASDCKKGVSVVLSHGNADETIADTLRDAIDAAMAKDGDA